MAPMPAKSFYVTTPIYYVNDAPHIGHAYTTVAGDVLTRWHRQRGEKVRYLTGTDEHGTKVSAKPRRTTSPQQWVDRLVDDHWRPVLETLDIANDDFIRTTERRHREGVQHFWQVLKESGHVYADVYEGPYCGLRGVQVPRRPDRRDQAISPARRCVASMAARSRNCARRTGGSPLGLRDELLQHYERNPDAVAPKSAYNEVVSFIRQGLKDISMSRPAWSGDPLPWDDKQVVYVWFDALFNYITAVGYGQDDHKELFAATWPADVHLVGKTSCASTPSIGRPC